MKVARKKPIYSAIASYVKHPVDKAKLHTEAGRIVLLLYSTLYKLLSFEKFSNKPVNTITLFHATDTLQLRKCRQRNLLHVSQIVLDVTSANKRDHTY
jgi:hypothetical protein